MTLNEYIEKLIEIRDQHPTFGDLPIIYSHDDEGNQYQKVDNDPGLFAVEDLDSRYPEPVFFEGMKAEDFNCIIIN